MSLSNSSKIFRNVDNQKYNSNFQNAQPIVNIQGKWVIKKVKAHEENFVVIDQFFQSWLGNSK